VWRCVGVCSRLSSSHHRLDRSGRRARADQHGTANARFRLLFLFYSARSSPATRVHPLGSSISPSPSSSNSPSRSSSSRRGYPVPSPSSSINSSSRRAKSAPRQCRLSLPVCRTPVLEWVARLPLGLAAHPCSSTKVRALPTAAPASSPSFARRAPRRARQPQPRSCARTTTRSPILLFRVGLQARAQEGQEHRLSVPLPSAATAAGLGAAARFRHCRRHQARTAHYPVAAGSWTVRGSSPCRPSVAASRSGGGAPPMPRHAARVAGMGDAVAVPRAPRRHHHPCSKCAANGPSSPLRSHAPRWPPSARTWASSSSRHAFAVWPNPLS
jgi:hypothetical protein